MDMNIIIITVLIILNLLLVCVFLFGRKGQDVKQKAPEKTDGLSVIGKTKSAVTADGYCSVAGNMKAAADETNREPTLEPEEDSPEIGEEFFPDMDTVDEEEIEIEELFASTGEDIRLDSNTLVSREIAMLQKVCLEECITESEKPAIRSVIAKLDGSEFLRMLKENEEKAEKRNRELLQMLEAEDTEIPPASTIPEKDSFSDDISLEDFL